MKRFLLTLLVLLCMFSVAEANEVRTGLLFHDIATVWGNAKIENGVDFRFEFVLGEGLIRPNIGATVNSKGYTSKIYAGALLSYPSERFVAQIGLGGCIQANAIRKLGSTALFRLSAELGYMFGNFGITFLLDHISNANLVRPNQGLDVVGLSVIYRWRQ